MRAAHLAERGYGDAWIRADLARQGVPSQLIEDAVGSLPPEAERAAALVPRLGGGPRAARALPRRGFDHEAVERILRGVAPDDGRGVG